MKTYSLLLAWNDRDTEEGEFGVTVRARNEAEAERKARKIMHESYVDQYCDGMSKAEILASAGKPQDMGGRVIDCQEGAIWRANDLEKALRELVNTHAEQGPAFVKAFEKAKALLADIDNPRF